MNFREWKYMKTSFTGVSHTTLNPRGPGVVRIHLVPPKHPMKEPSVVILNGQDIIPVNPSWTVLLNNFIHQVNQLPDQALAQDDLDRIVAQTTSAEKAEETVWMNYGPPFVQISMLDGGDGKWR